MSEHIYVQPFIEMHPAITRTLDSIGAVFDSIGSAISFSRLCQEELLLRGHIAPEAMERISRAVNGET